MHAHQNHYAHHLQAAMVIFIGFSPTFAIAAECRSSFPEFSPHQDTYGVACSKLPGGGTFSFRITTPPTNGIIGRFTTSHYDELIYFTKNFLPDTIGYEVIAENGAIVEAGTTFISLESITNSTTGDSGGGEDNGNECNPPTNQRTANIAAAAAIDPNCGT